MHGFITGNPAGNCKVTAAASNGRGTTKVPKKKKKSELNWIYQIWAKKLSYWLFKNRAYEPDPLRLTSMAELESCEKHLVETLSNVVQRKVWIFPFTISLIPSAKFSSVFLIPHTLLVNLQEYLLSNHLSSYDPSPIQVMFFLMKIAGNYLQFQILHTKILKPWNFIGLTQQGLPPSFENEVVNWQLPDNGQNQSQMFDASASLNSLRYIHYCISCI